MAGQAASALFTGGLAVVLNRQLDWLRVQREFRIALVLVAVFNPLVFYSAIKGMTENIFLFFVLAALDEFVRWQPEEQRGLLVAALLLALSFFVRYEAIAFAAAGVIGLIIRTWTAPRRLLPRPSPRCRTPSCCGCCGRGSFSATRSPF